MVNIFFIVGVVAIIIALISSGALVDGGDQRGNFYTESTEDRHARNKVGLIAFLIGIVSLVLAGLIYYL